MPKPLAICIEDLDAPKASRYVQCVALPGRQPGLRLNDAGRAIWFSEQAVACELWVSADDRLILYRPEGAASATVRRAGRSLDVPFAKPVILLDKDEVDVGPRHLRIHIHGEATTVAAPTPLRIKPGPLDRLAQTAATAAVIGALATGCIEVRETPPTMDPPTRTPTVEVRDYPPEPVMPPETPTIEGRDFPPTATAPSPTETPTIEVRDNPPSLAITSTPDAPMPTPTIEVRDFPPTATPSPVVPVIEGSVAWALQGPWTVAQSYTVDGQTVWFNGTLTLAGGSYSFTPSTEGTPPAAGTLNFLFDNPWGTVYLVYADGVAPESPLTDFAPGDTLANCTFYGGSIVNELRVKVGESGSLSFTPLSGEDGQWSITR